MSPHQARAAYQPIDCHSDDKTAYQSYNDRYPPPASIQDDDGQTEDSGSQAYSDGINDPTGYPKPSLYDDNTERQSGPYYHTTLDTRSQDLERDGSLHNGFNQAGINNKRHDLMDGTGYGTANQEQTTFRGPASPDTLRHTQRNIGQPPQLLQRDPSTHRPVKSSTTETRRVQIAGPTGNPRGSLPEMHGRTLGRPLGSHLSPEKKQSASDTRASGACPRAHLKKIRCECTFEADWYWISRNFEISQSILPVEDVQHLIVGIVIPDASHVLTWNWIPMGGCVEINDRDEKSGFSITQFDAFVDLFATQTVNRAILESLTKKEISSCRLFLRMSGYLALFLQVQNITYRGHDVELEAELPKRISMSVFTFIMDRLEKLIKEVAKSSKRSATAPPEGQSENFLRVTLAILIAVVSALENYEYPGELPLRITQLMSGLGEYAKHSSGAVHDHAHGVAKTCTIYSTQEFDALCSRVLVGFQQPVEVTYDRMSVKVDNLPGSPRGSELPLLAKQQSKPLMARPPNYLPNSEPGFLHRLLDVFCRHQSHQDLLSSFKHSQLPLTRYPKEITSADVTAPEGQAPHDGPSMELPSNVVRTNQQTDIDNEAETGFEGQQLQQTNYCTSNPKAGRRRAAPNSAHNPTTVSTASSRYFSKRESSTRTSAWSETSQPKRPRKA